VSGPRPERADATAFSEIVARGRLGPTGVDPLAGTADRLRRAGHEGVVLERRCAGVLDDGVRSMVEELTEEDGDLVVRCPGEEGLA
jgi:hypothetical protein